MFKIGNHLVVYQAGWMCFTGDLPETETMGSDGLLSDGDEDLPTVQTVQTSSDRCEAPKKACCQGGGNKEPPRTGSSEERRWLVWSPRRGFGDGGDGGRCLKDPASPSTKGAA